MTPGDDFYAEAMREMGPAADAFLSRHTGLERFERGPLVLLYALCSDGGRLRMREKAVDLYNHAPSGAAREAAEYFLAVLDIVEAALTGGDSS